jgi:hypothetical protein
LFGSVATSVHEPEHRAGCCPIVHEQLPMMHC